jgi:hypothetical protein
MIAMRHLAFLGSIRLALRIMAEMAQKAFWRVGALRSIVRRKRGMLGNGPLERHA